MISIQDEILESDSFVAVSDFMANDVSIRDDHRATFLHPALPKKKCIKKTNPALPYPVEQGRAGYPAKLTNIFEKI
jgi:hypothetical protein